jgi:hypothetical protein
MYQSIEMTTNLFNNMGWTKIRIATVEEDLSLSFSLALPFYVPVCISFRVSTFFVLEHVKYSAYCSLLKVNGNMDLDVGLVTGDPLEARDIELNIPC